MRDQLEDAALHRDDGYGRAQKHIQQTFPKRFYAETGVAETPEGWAVTLDGKPMRTPGRKPVRVPTRALAETIATEWAGMGTHIMPNQMPVTRLVNSAVETGPEGAAALRQSIHQYAAGDLLLYRAEYPTDLVAAQEAAWDPILVGLARRFEIVFQPTIGILHQQQPATTLARLAALLEPEDHFALASMVAITGITGSGLIAIAYRHSLVTREQALTAAYVDEDHNIRMWGEDEEAAARRADKIADFDAALALLARLPGAPSA
ncbi:Chaperone required for the assembly of the F1-ATPase [Devosia enhydra]|uniref:Chaperone required for the assembly of the F1-ATPase n=1 Tax=Devosia enhydra TaxID=665118 RepID=A0A1K2HSW7_9HYPH|nr:ATP12 family protein [Devosia enhydra]SFZ81157.1 Chaperone required for the assembly of the F1-ATPase [Devosia enhydra]